MYWTEPFDEIDLLPEEESRAEKRQKNGSNESSFPDAACYSSDSDDDYETSAMIEIFTPELCDALDRVKISDRNALYIISEIPMIKKLNLKFSRSTLRRRRISNRLLKLEKVKRVQPRIATDNPLGLKNSAAIRHASKCTPCCNQCYRWKLGSASRGTIRSKWAWRDGSTSCLWPNRKLEGWRQSFVDVFWYDGLQYRSEIFDIYCEEDIQFEF